MIDLEYEKLLDDAYSNDDCFTSFIESNAEDVDLYLSERGIHHDYQCDHEIDYIETHEDQFIEYYIKHYIKS